MTKYVKKNYAGYLLRKELTFLGGTLENPRRPLAALIGGAKISSKLAVLLNLLKRVDKLIVGGAMVYTFYRALGFTVGDSLVEENMIPIADEIIKTAERTNVSLILASDSLIVPTDVLNEPQKQQQRQRYASQEAAAMVTEAATTSPSSVARHEQDYDSEAKKAAKIELFPTAAISDTDTAEKPCSQKEQEISAEQEETPPSTGKVLLVKELTSSGHLATKPRICGDDSVRSSSSSRTTHDITTKKQETVGSSSSGCSDDSGSSSSSTCMRMCRNDEIPDGWIGVDIGEASIAAFCKELEDCRTVLWNGKI